MDDTVRYVPAGACRETSRPMCPEPDTSAPRHFGTKLCLVGIVLRPKCPVTDVCCCVQPFSIDDSYCGERDMNHPIHGTDPVWREAALTWTSARVSTVAVTSTGRHTVAFVGTVDGQLKKVGLTLMQCSNCRRGWGLRVGEVEPP